MLTEQKFNAAAERHLDMVYRIALNCLRVSADAEDAAQTVMLRLWQTDAAFGSATSVGISLWRWIRYRLWGSRILSSPPSNKRKKSACQMTDALLAIT